MEIGTFANSVTVSGATVASDDNMATADSPIVDGNIVTVNLHNVSNAQRLLITLQNVNDGTNSGGVTVSMSVLLGDTNANSVVNAADISQTKSQTGNPVSASNFREDVNANGSIYGEIRRVNNFGDVREHRVSSNFAIRLPTREGKTGRGRRDRFKTEML